VIEQRMVTLGVAPVPGREQDDPLGILRTECQSLHEYP
jgi:hypothetical protein